ncbi:MAG: phage tail family protein [Mogibacterium sp.]|nr:phage tail family protein [Mogibacterium sp.]
MRNYLIFGGVNSANYGIYITGSGVYNAPKRAVENIVVPGRNGLLTIDQGRYENITVEYPAFAFGKTREEFQQKITAFRNAIMSQIGYQRLEDTYHPDEYRMALYAEGLNVDVKPYGSSGKFTLSFNCKPQRFLRDGEHTVAKANGEKIINPTPHESSPMLEVEGYGTIGFNGYEITINDVVIGEIETSTRSSQSIGKIPNSNLPKTFSKTIDYSAHAGALETGDSLFVDAIKLTVKSLALGTGATPAPTITSNIGTASASGAVRNYSQVESGGTWNYADYTTAASISGIELTAFTDESYSATLTSVLKYDNNSTIGTVTVGISITNTASGVLTIQVVCNGTSAGPTDLYSNGGTIEYGRSYLYSTQSILGSPLYIDCDLGEAYKFEGDTIVSINQHVDLGTDLPKLASGENEITFDDTVTDLKITPRWWKI